MAAAAAADGPIGGVVTSAATAVTPPPAPDAGAAPLPNGYGSAGAGPAPGELAWSGFELTGDVQSILDQNKCASTIHTLLGLGSRVMQLLMWCHGQSCSELITQAYLSAMCWFCKREVRQKCPAGMAMCTALHSSRHHRMCAVVPQAADHRDQCQPRGAHPRGAGEEPAAHPRAQRQHCQGTPCPSHLLSQLVAVPTEADFS
jgi:hypothetical protein